MPPTMKAVANQVLLVTILNTWYPVASPNSTAKIMAAGKFGMYFHR